MQIFDRVVEIAPEVLPCHSLSRKIVFAIRSALRCAWKVVEIWQDCRQHSYKGKSKIFISEVPIIEIHHALSLVAADHHPEPKSVLIGNNWCSSHSRHWLDNLISGKHA